MPYKDFQLHTSGFTKTKEAGFSLIEVLITLAIVGVVASFAQPSFYHFKQKHSADNTIQKLSNMLKGARYSAVDERHDTVVCGSSDLISCTGQWQQGIIAFTDLNQNGSREPQEPILRSETETTELGSIAFNSPSATVRFSSDGFTKGSFGSFWYCPHNKNPKFYRKLSINLQGQIKKKEVAPNELQQNKVC